MANVPSLHEVKLDNQQHILSKIEYMKHLTQMCVKEMRIMYFAQVHFVNDWLHIWMASLPLAMASSSLRCQIKHSCSRFEGHPQMENERPTHE